MDARVEVERLLKVHGGVLIRHKKHRIWKLSSGKKWTTPSTPSDRNAWQNNLGELRLMLGLKSSDKTMADFVFRKKEAYVKPFEQPKEFLATVEGEELIVAPLNPETAAERLVEELRRKEMDSKVFPLFGRVPLKLQKGVGHRGSARSGRAYTFSPEVMARASYLMEQQGQAVMNSYLAGVRNGKHIETKSNEEEKEMDGFDYGEGSQSGTKVVTGGGIEEQLREAKERLRVHQVAVQQHTLEAQREEMVITALSEALRITTAPRQTLKEMVQSNQPVVSADNGTGKKRKSWRPIIELVVGTTPVTFTRKKLLEELMRTENAGYYAVYGAIHTALNKGWLVEGKDGFIELERRQDDS